MEALEICRIIQVRYAGHLSSRTEVTAWVWHNNGHSLFLVLLTNLRPSTWSTLKCQARCIVRTFNSSHSACLSPPYRCEYQ